MTHNLAFQTIWRWFCSWVDKPRVGGFTPTCRFRGSAPHPAISPQLPLRCAGTALLQLQGYSQAPPGGVFPWGADEQRDGLLVAGGHPVIQAGAEHLRRLPCLAKNPARVRSGSGPSCGHFRMSGSAWPGAPSFERFCSKGGKPQPPTDPLTS